MNALTHLEKLVEFDTRNPPRKPEGLVALFAYVQAVTDAAGFDVEVRDLEDGCLWFRAVRGTGGVLMNFHVDTVPADPAWEGDPLEMRVGLVDGERCAVGLGTCDIKGALAAFLVAAEQTTGPVELLLTTDEEAGTSRCVRTFAEEHDLRGRRVLVAEPTKLEAVVAHRGIGTCTGIFQGVGGHASQVRALEDSAVHEAVHWAERALTQATREDIRFNLGLFEGGVKANMIAARALTRFGVRPMRDPSTVIDELCALALHPDRVDWAKGYLAPPLLSTDDNRAFGADLGLPIAMPVDFFTEAALFAEGGAVAVVAGPGDIARAHTAGERVAVNDLDAMTSIYVRLLGAAEE